jgi:hypothetical protein
MKNLPDDVGRLSTSHLSNAKDALAHICEINEQCLQMLVSVARQVHTPPESFLHHLFSLIGTLDQAGMATTARFPFLLVDFGFRDLAWWQSITPAHRRAGKDLSWLVPFPRAAAMKLARATLTLAWHTVRTDTEATLVLLGISPPVAEHIASLRLQDIDRIAERHYRRLRPRWEDRPAVWRQLLACSRETDVNAAHEFVLHALQLTAAGSLPVTSSQRARKPAPSTSLRP